MNDVSVKRHSMAHVLASAVLKLYPDTKLGIGPSIDDGFYYDFEFSFKFNEDNFGKIKDEMSNIIKSDVSFEKGEWTTEEAKTFMKDQPYKIDLINELESLNEKPTFYKSGEFTDLCAGPHISNSNELASVAFEIDRTAGAYWRGREDNKMMTRIYVLCFETQAELDEFKAKKEEAKLRDHKKLGKELDLFVFSDLVGPGLPLYTFRGSILRREIIKFSNELQGEIGYKEVHTPNMNKGELFKVSGHYDKYKEDMFRVVSNYGTEEYFLKPMNCPQHTQIFAASSRSYKELPIRIADFANLYRDEKPGELSGLTRLRCFCQDDGHCFCMESQIEAEFLSVLSAIRGALSTYGMNYTVRLSLWDPATPEKYLGDPKTWEMAQEKLEKILKENNIEYFVGVGEAAIYGPKMDVMTTDSIGRKWQISTIQLDFIMPQRFGLTYTDNEGLKKTPVMIHRAITGSPERFMGILIEHYAGNFPTWLAPEQIRIVGISAEKHSDYVNSVAAKMRKAGIRVEVDLDNETLGNKIRKATSMKLPYVVVVGDKEMESNVLNIRVRGEKDTVNVNVDEFITKITEKISGRVVDLVL